MNDKTNNATSIQNKKRGTQAIAAEQEFEDLLRWAVGLSPDRQKRSPLKVIRRKHEAENERS